MSEHRKETRQRVFLKGRIIFNHGASSMDCLVRDLSASGARLALSETTTLPEVFDLYIPQKDRTYRSVLRWRREDGVGITFTETARRRSPHPARRRAAAGARPRRLAGGAPAPHQRARERERRPAPGPRHHGAARELRQRRLIRRRAPPGCGRHGPRAARVGHAALVTPQGHALVPGHDMDVQVEHRLPARRLVVLEHRQPVRREGRLHGPGDALHRGRQGRERGRLGIEEPARRRLGDHQRVALALGHHVHEGERLGILVDLVGGDLAAQDLGEDVVGVVGGHRRLGRCAHGGSVGRKSSAGIGAARCTARAGRVHGRARPPSSRRTATARPQR